MSIVSYQLTLSDECSSDESENAELVQLFTGVPFKKFCPDQQEETDSTPNAQEQKEDDEEEEQKEQQQQSASSKTDHKEHNEQEINEELEGCEMQDDFNHSVPAARKQSYALDQKELPGEMQTFLREVKRFFTRQVNLERQAKPLAMSTYRKAQEQML